MEAIETLLNSNLTLRQKFRTILNASIERYTRNERKLDFIEFSDSLLQSQQSEENIKLVKEMLLLHRQLENTKARRRLERWSSSVIKWYLIIVGIFVVLSYTNIGNLHLLDIPEHIMIAILTTTTVNVIGLVVIVLKGHFQNKEKVKKDTEE